VTTRANRIGEIERIIGRRKLIWFGTRGEDAAPLLSIRQFAECFSLIAPLGSIGVREICLEKVRGERVDLDNYTPDLDTSPEADELHLGLYTAVGEPSVVAVYRPTAFFTSVYFPRADTVQYLGLFHERQVAFEHKPWLETELQRVGVKVLPWQYYGDDDRQRLSERLSRGPQVIRTSRSDGGIGLRVVRDEAELHALWPAHRDRFVAATDYLSPSIPLNVNGVVFGDGSVSLHGPSLQLIGIAGFTSLPLGYCGNDFAAVKDLDPEFVAQLESIALGAGQWLARHGYLGAFGVDALVSGGEVFLTEVNPRFQGSSSVAAEIDRRMDRPDMFLENIAAFLGLEAPRRRPLVELVASQAPLAHVVPHNLLAGPVEMAEPTAFGQRAATWQLIPANGIAVLPDAILARAVYEHSITNDGFHLNGDLAAEILAQCSEAYIMTSAIRGGD